MTKKLTSKKLLPSAPPTSPALERHYTSAEIGVLWGFDPTTVRRMFADEPGVLKIGKKSRGTRVYFSIRIPASVAQRVHDRNTQKGS